MVEGTHVFHPLLMGFLNDHQSFFRPFFVGRRAGVLNQQHQQKQLQSCCEHHGHGHGGCCFFAKENALK